MSESPPTRATLVFRLRDQTDNAAWGQFIELYGPMIYRFVLSRGLQDADAADLVQNVFRRVSQSIGKLEYAKEKGGFRAWLFTITRNCLFTHFEKQQRAQQSIKPATIKTIEQIADKNELEQDWEHEHQRQLMSRAIDKVKPTVEPKTWLAFEKTAIEGSSAESTGKQIGLSRGAVYVAKSRVTAKLREEVERMMKDEQ